eukprot:2563853-Prymnesium_polylepis.1
MKAFSWYCNGYTEVQCPSRMFQRGFRDNQGAPSLVEDTSGNAGSNYRYGIFVMCRWSGTGCVTSDGLTAKTNWVAAPKLNPTEYVYSATSAPDMSATLGQLAYTFDDGVQTFWTARTPAHAPTHNTYE